MLVSTESQVLLHDVTWEEYEAILDQVEASGRHLFVTFDDGSLEVMVPGPDHETDSKSLDYLLVILAEELDVSLEPLGSTTFRRKGLAKGLEPDECYYTKNSAKIRGKSQLDLRRDPPPDLVVEVEITRRLLDRVSIYEALGVPELWRYDGRKLRVFVLVKGKYRERDRSPTFPTLPLDQVGRWLNEKRSMDRIPWNRRVRAWVRKHLAK